MCTSSSETVHEAKHAISLHVDAALLLPHTWIIKPDLQWHQCGTRGDAIMLHRLGLGASITIFGPSLPKTMKAMNRRKANLLEKVRSTQAREQPPGQDSDTVNSGRANLVENPSAEPWKTDTGAGSRSRPGAASTAAAMCPQELQLNSVTGQDQHHSATGQELQSAVQVGFRAHIESWFQRMAQMSTNTVLRRGA